MAQILMAIPDDTLFNTGIYLKHVLSMAEMMTMMVTALTYLKGLTVHLTISGMTIATNIPYIAMPRALIIRGGSTFPRIAPRRVPTVHPIQGRLESPAKKLLETDFSEDATAKISSVMKKPKIHLHIPLNFLSTFWVREIDMKL